MIVYVFDSCKQQPWRHIAMFCGLRHNVMPPFVVAGGAADAEQLALGGEANCTSYLNILTMQWTLAIIAGFLRKRLETITDEDIETFISGSICVVVDSIPVLPVIQPVSFVDGSCCKSLDKKGKRASKTLDIEKVIYTDRKLCCRLRFMNWDNDLCLMKLTIPSWLRQ